MRKKKILLSFQNDLIESSVNALGGENYAGGCGTEEYKASIPYPYDEGKFIQKLFLEFKKRISIGRRNGQYWEPLE